MRILFSLLVLFPCALLPAQNFTVSPAYAAKAEGNTIDTFPFGSQSVPPRPTFRYQQIHNDVRGNLWLLQGLSFRRDEAGYADMAFARTLDIEIFAGEGNYDTATTTFSTNFLGQRSQVVNRKNINLPDFTKAQGSPAPWNIVIAFDAPHPYFGQQDLLWEILIHSMTSAGQYPCDAHRGVIGANTSGIGTSCTATGQPSPIWFLPSFVTAINLLRFGVFAMYCPPSAGAVVVAGHLDPNLAIPGLCTALRAAPIILFPGVTAAGGFYTPPDTDFPAAPELVGASIYSQLFVSDPGQSGLPFAASNGMRSVLAAPPTSKIRRIWSNDVNATLGNRIEIYPYGLVVRFTHQ